MNKQATNKYLIISKRYAKALIKIAYQKGLVDTFLNDFSLIKEVLSSSSDLDELLLNPIVSSNKKKEIVVEVFGEKINSDVLNFLKILIDNNKFKIWQYFFGLPY